MGRPEEEKPAKGWQQVEKEKRLVAQHLGNLLYISYSHPPENISTNYSSGGGGSTTCHVIGGDYTKLFPAIIGLRVVIKLDLILFHVL